MATIKGLYRCIDSCNGEIRLMAARYELGWYCIIAETEVEDSVWGKWEDLVGGDNDYFEARYFLSDHSDVTLVRCDTPESAFSSAIKLAAARLNGWEES